MTDPHREELILRYITGKLSSDAALRARTYLDETPRGHVVGIGLRQVMAADVLEGGAPDTQTSLARLLARLDHEIPHLTGKMADGVGVAKPTVELPRSVAAVPTGVRGRKQGMLGPQPLRSWTGWHVISGLALSAMLLTAGWAIGHRAPAPNRTRRPPLTYSTGSGERANITLPDGSAVALDVASRLEIPVDYVAGNHTMRLTGEALFTVLHHDGAPFTVLAGGAATRVLGTSFLVRHYASDTTTTVAVRDGKVMVGSVVLTAHQLVEVKNNSTWQVVPADAAEFSFATGTLTLPEMPLVQAIPELNRWYDADIRLGDSTLAVRHIVGEFAAGSLADIRAILAMTFDVRVVRAGKTLTLYPR